MKQKITHWCSQDSWCSTDWCLCCWTGTWLMYWSCWFTCDVFVLLTCSWFVSDVVDIAGELLDQEDGNAYARAGNAAWLRTVRVRRRRRRGRRCRWVLCLQNFDLWFCQKIRMLGVCACSCEGKRMERDRICLLTQIVKDGLFILISVVFFAFWVRLQL